MKGASRNPNLRGVLVKDGLDTGVSVVATTPAPHRRLLFCQVQRWSDQWSVFSVWAKVKLTYWSACGAHLWKAKQSVLCPGVRVPGMRFLGPQSPISLSVRAGVQSRSGQLWPEVATELQTRLTAGPLSCHAGRLGGHVSSCLVPAWASQESASSISCFSSHLFSNLYEASVGHWLSNIWHIISEVFLLRYVFS